MHKMHPEIKKFWTEEGYSYIENENQESSVTGPDGKVIYLGTVTGHLNLGGPFNISRMDTLAFGDQHRFKGVWYSEEQMLRIIRLKAFL
jgi:hypothetical protein